MILRRIDGEITVPNFLDGTRIARDPASRPKIVGTTQVPFIAIIPRSAGAKAPIWIYGHGLFSDRTELLRDFARDTASAGKAVIAGTDFTGLDGANESNAISAFLDPPTFADIVDPLRQSYINTLLLPRTLAGACACAARIPGRRRGDHRRHPGCLFRQQHGRHASEPRWPRSLPTCLASGSVWPGWICRCRCRATTPGRESRPSSRPSGRAGSIATSSS